MWITERRQLFVNVNLAVSVGVAACCVEERRAPNHTVCRVGLVAASGPWQ
jgi:hypothetical protein